MKDKLITLINSIDDLKLISYIYAFVVTIVTQAKH